MSSSDPATTVRPATVDDAGAIESLRLASWRATYGRLLPPDAFDGIDRDAVRARFAARLRSGPSRTLVTERDGAVTAFVVYGPCRDDDVPPTGEVYALYADPAHWSTGQGRALLAAAMAELRAEWPDGPLLLWVLVDNPRARRFYEIAGWRPDGTEKAAQLLGGVTLPEMRYRLDIAAAPQPADAGA